MSAPQICKQRVHACIFPGHMGTPCLCHESASRACMHAWFCRPHGDALSVPRICKQHVRACMNGFAGHMGTPCLCHESASSMCVHACHAGTQCLGHESASSTCMLASFLRHARQPADFAGCVGARCLRHES
eukprot:62845-Pelagomonas_calceolata.AAC.1